MSSAKTRWARRSLALLMVATLTVAGAPLASGGIDRHKRVVVTGYFKNAKGIFVGDQVRILGVPVGQISRIEPEPDRVKVTFWYGSEFDVPADAGAAILAPALVTARTIQLTPPYTGGPTMRGGATIPLERTAVPVEWDTIRVQLQKLTEAMEPSALGGASPVGAMVSSAAANTRGQGANIRETLIQLSAALSAIGDHSSDISSVVRDLSTFVSALQSSDQLLGELNQNLAAVGTLLARDDNAIGQAVTDLDTAAVSATDFARTHRDSVGTFSEKLTAVSDAIVASMDDIKQALHVGPTTFQNYVNTYHPARGSLTASLVLNNFADPITFLCGGIQAASRANAEQAAKLCVQYLAPIVKNRQYNFPPIGFGALGPAVNGAMARPNEVTYSEDRLRPDYRPTPGDGADPQPGGIADLLLPAEAGR